MPFEQQPKKKSLIQGQTRILLKNSSWVFAGNTIRAILVFVKAIILVNILDKEIYGVYIIVVEFVTMVLEFFNLNMGTSVIKFGADYRAKKEGRKFSGLLKLSLFTLFLSSLLSFIVLAFILKVRYNTFIPEEGLQVYIYAYAVAGCLVFLETTFLGVLRLFYKFKGMSVIRLLSTAFEVLIMSVMVWMSPTLIAAITALIISRFVGTSILVIGGIRLVKDDFDFDRESKMSDIKPEFVKIGSFTLSNSIGRSVQALIKRGDVMMLNIMLGELAPPVVAVYNVAKKLGTAMMVIIDPLTNSILPQLSNLLAKEKYRDTKKLLAQITGLALVAAVVGVVVTYFLKDFMLDILFTEDYSESATPLMVIVISSLFSAAFFWSLSLLQGLGLTWLRLWISIFSGIIGAIVAWITIPEFKATGAALGAAAANIVMVSLFSALSYIKVVKLSKDAS